MTMFVAYISCFGFCISKSAGDVIIINIPLLTSFFELGIDISLRVQQESLYHFSFLLAAVIVFTNNFYYVFIRDFRQIP